MLLLSIARQGCSGTARAPMLVALTTPPAARRWPRPARRTRGRVPAQRRQFECWTARVQPLDELAGEGEAASEARAQQLQSMVRAMRLAACRRATRTSPPSTGRATGSSGCALSSVAATRAHESERLALRQMARVEMRHAGVGGPRRANRRRVTRRRRPRSSRRAARPHRRRRSASVAASGAAERAGGQRSARCCRTRWRCRCSLSTTAAPLNATLQQLTTEHLQLAKRWRCRRS